MARVKIGHVHAGLGREVADDDLGRCPSTGRDNNTRYRQVRYDLLVRCSRSAGRECEHASPVRRRSIQMAPPKLRSAPRRASRRLPSSGTRRRSTRASVGPAPWPARGRCRSCTRSPRRVFPRQRSSRRLSTRWPMVTSGARPATDGPGLVVSESPCASPKSASMLSIDSLACGRIDSASAIRIKSLIAFCRNGSTTTAINLICAAHARRHARPCGLASG